MVSSLFHHISILRLDVSLSYLEYLAKGTTATFTHADKSWCSPKMYRTKWYDLLIAEDRTEALRCLWGVMSYMLRTGETAKPEVQRQPSEVSHHFSFRKKHRSVQSDPTARSRSVT